MPGWPSFLQGNNGGNKEHYQNEAAVKGMSAGALRTAQELRAIFDKWVAAVTAAAGQNQQLDDTPPPRYTPRAGTEETQTVTEAPPSHPPSTAGRLQTNMLQAIPSSDMRPVEYMRVKLTDQEVNAYAYSPNAKQTQKLQKKHDRMLVVFWLPILFLSCIWAFYSFVVFAFQAVKAFLPLKAPLRG